MKSERAWIGITCGFFLFIVVCLFLLPHMNGVFRAAGNSEVGLLFFLLPGAAASSLSPGRRVILPVVGAILAAPVCLLAMRLFFVAQRTFWQQLAWLFSAVFWCALGALCFMFICAWLDSRRKHSSRE